MSQFRPLSESVMASPQITLDDINSAAAEGVTLIICNRPDNEEPGQLNGESVRAAAAAKGISFAAIPISNLNVDRSTVEAMADALESADGKVLAYCRTGTRSTFLWSFASSLRGGDHDQIIAQAAQAGYDVSPARTMMEQLAPGV